MCFQSYLIFSSNIFKLVQLWICVIDYQLYISLEAQPENGCSCTSRNILLQGMIYDWTHISINYLNESYVTLYSIHLHLYNCTIETQRGCLSWKSQDSYLVRDWKRHGRKLQFSDVRWHSIVLPQQRLPQSKKKNISVNPLTPELNPSAQNCLTRYFTFLRFLNRAFR
jgi:hypothetical protein